MFVEHAKNRVSLETVATVLRYTFPSLQRSVDAAHVQAMVEDQRREFEAIGEFSLLQSLTVARVLQDGKVYVLDGQHRVRCFLALRDLGYPVDAVIVPVVCYRVADRNELAAYFNRINQNLPVHPLDLRDGEGDPRVKFAKAFVAWLQSTYGPYVKRPKQGAGVRCPHLSLESLKDEIAGRIDACAESFDADGVLRGMCSAVVSFDADIRAIHEEERDGLEETLRKRMDDCAKKVSAKQQRCYLGLFKKYEWFDACMECVRNAKDAAAVEVPRWMCKSLATTCGGGASVSNCVSRREKISHVVRREVWAKVNQRDFDAGKCYTCDADLRFGNMECGHVVAHAMGGRADVANLMPVCRTCNRDMGIQNLEDYRQRILRSVSSAGGGDEAQQPTLMAIDG